MSAPKELLKNELVRMAEEMGLDHDAALVFVDDMIAVLRRIKEQSSNPSAFRPRIQELIYELDEAEPPDETEKIH